MNYFHSLLLLLAISTGLLNAQSNGFALGDVQSEVSNTQTALISEVNQTAPGESFTIAIELAHQDGWHAYYQNPGGPGLPLEFDWQLPAGYTLTKLHWPTPHIYGSGETQFYTYEGRYALLADIAVPSTAQAGSQAEIHVTPTWQLCDENGCAIPTSRKLNIKIPIGQSQSLSAEHAGLFQSARAKLPQTNESWNVESKIKGSELVLTISSSDGSVAIVDSLHYIDNAGLTDSSKPQVLNDRGDAYILKAPLSASAKPGSKIEGILIFDGQEAVAISSPLSNPAAEALSSEVLGAGGEKTNSAAHGIGNKAPTAAEIAAAAELYDAEQKIDFVLLDGSKEKAHSLSTALGFIFIGGLLLNLMPCVFPVLGLKVMGFAQQAGSEPQKIKIHGLVFMAGVVVSMWILAGIIYILIFSFGRDINWGEQLTSPIFLASIIMLLYLFGLNMAGVFEARHFPDRGWR